MSDQEPLASRRVFRSGDERLIFAEPQSPGSFTPWRGVPSPRVNELLKGWFMQQNPSVGRIVLMTADPHANNGADVAPAVITRVWSDTCINVRVLRDGTDVAWMTSVGLFESREDLEAAREKRIEELRAAGYQEPIVFHGAYWPPRV